MNRWTGTFVAMIVCALLAVVVFFLIDMSSDKVFATPQEAFDEARAALKKNDMRGFFQCLTNDSRDLYAAELIIGEFSKRQEIEKDGSPDDKAGIKTIEKVFTQHGLTGEFLAKVQENALAITHPQAPLEEKLKAAHAILAPVSDPSGFLADLFKAIQKGKDGENPFSGLIDAKLSNVKTIGKSAVGEISLPGQRQPSPMNFSKQGEGWRIDLFAEQKQQRPMMPPGHP
jgi:hypothetical protein